MTKNEKSRGKKESLTERCLLLFLMFFFRISLNQYERRFDDRKEKNSTGGFPRAIIIIFEQKKNLSKTFWANIQVKIHYYTHEKTLDEEILVFFISIRSKFLM